MAHGDGVTASSTSSLNVTDQGQSESEQFRCCAQTTGLYSLGWCCLGFICLVVGFSSSAYYMTHHSNVSSVFDGPGRFCQTPTLRREWRSLPAAEKRDYIRAVRCLKTVPSQLYLNHSLYDDFPWIHINYGKYSHDAAPFLAWHRYFIHTYEQKLQEQCGYKGHLTYWDWTLDWENIASSPVWNVETGFGGNGNFSVGHPVLKAHCVTEGPFAGLEVLYFENIYQPHCLLRGFDKPPKSFRRELQPKALLKLLLSPDYDSINLGLEHGPHNAIPRSINGDFSLQMAPFGKNLPCRVQTENRSDFSKTQSSSSIIHS